MEEGIKNRIILVLFILTLIFFVGTIGSCKNARQIKASRDKEVLTRLELEEKLNKFTQEKTAAEEKLKSLAQALEEEKTAHEAIKKALSQEQLVNQSLKEELEKVSKLKDALEEDLKEALVAGKSSKNKR